MPPATARPSPPSALRLAPPATALPLALGATGAHAALERRAGGTLVHDTVRDLTWVADGSGFQHHRHLASGGQLFRAAVVADCVPGLHPPANARPQRVACMSVLAGRAA